MTSKPRPPLRGYQQKPLSIILIAFVFLTIPLVFLLQVFMSSGGSWRVVLDVARSEYFVREWWLAWSAAAAVYIVSRWTFAYFVLLSAYVLITKVQHLLTHPHLETPISLVVTAFWFAVVIYLLGSSLKAPYLNPKLRWWTRPRRVTMCRDARLRYHGTPIPVVVVNLSSGGAFVRVKDGATRTHPIPQRLGERCLLTMSLIRRGRSNAKPWRFHSTTEVAWQAAPDSPYRDGMGLKFVSLSRPQRWQLKRFLLDEARHQPRPAV